MTYKANDGREFSGRMAMNSHNASLRGMGHKTGAAPVGPDQPQEITDDPRAMKLVDELKQMGYTAEDVEKAMGGAGDEEQNVQQAAAAAPMQIPGA